MARLCSGLSNNERMVQRVRSMILETIAWFSQALFITFASRGRLTSLATHGNLEVIRRSYTAREAHDPEGFPET